MRLEPRKAGAHVIRPPQPACTRLLIALLAATVVSGVAKAQEQQAAIGDPLPAPGEVGAAPAPVAAPSPAGPTEPRLIITPSITIGETATDNVRSTPTNRQSDLVTTIAPRLFVTNQSLRLNGSFDYAPTILRHIQATDQDSIDQQLLGNGTLTAIPQFLFLDANASVSDQSRTGSRGFGNTTEIPSSERTQQIAYGASPYARFRFDNVADSELRYRFNQTNFNGNTGALTSPITGQTLSALSNATDQEGLATITSSPDLSKLTAKALADYDQTTYSDAALSSRHALGRVDFRYPLTHSLYALAGGGYERLTYSQQPQLNTTGPVWSAGALYEHNDKQFVSLTYGRSEGQNSFAGNARYALTPVTSVYGSYSEYRASTQQQILQNMLSAAPTAQGTAVDPSTGLPISITNPNLPLQNDITYTKSFQLGASTGLGRNHLSLVANHVDQTSLLHLAPSQRSTGGFLTWGHDLSPSATSNVLLGYSTVSPGAANVVTFSAGLAYALGNAYQAGAQYQLVSTSGGNTANVLTNSLTLTLTKTF